LVTLLIWTGVGCFGAVGALARFRVDSAVSAWVLGDFPLGTLAVNLTGALGLGVLVGLAAPHRVAFLLGTGFAGGYTTFSTWMVESVRLGELHSVVLMLRNLWLSMSLGIGLVAAGFYVGQAIS
jgi:fluoride exporter